MCYIKEKNLGTDFKTKYTPVIATDVERILYAMAVELFGMEARVAIINSKQLNKGRRLRADAAR